MLIRFEVCFADKRSLPPSEIKRSLPPSEIKRSLPPSEIKRSLPPSEIRQISPKASKKRNYGRSESESVEAHLPKFLISKFKSAKVTKPSLLKSALKFLSL